MKKLNSLKRCVRTTVWTCRTKTAKIKKEHIDVMAMCCKSNISLFDFCCFSSTSSYCRP